MNLELLTHRERLLRTLRRHPVERVPDLEFGAWVQTDERGNLWRDVSESGR